MNNYGFDEEAYAAFQEAALDKYDFQTCQRDDGSYYGTGGQCRKGTPAEKAEKDGDSEKSAAAGLGSLENSDTKLAGVLSQMDSEMSEAQDRAIEVGENYSQAKEIVDAKEYADELRGKVDWEAMQKGDMEAYNRYDAANDTYRDAMTDAEFSDPKLNTLQQKFLNASEKSSAAWDKAIDAEGTSGEEKATEKALKAGEAVAQARNKLNKGMQDYVKKNSDDVSEGDPPDSPAALKAMIPKVSGKRSYEAWIQAGVEASIEARQKENPNFMKGESPKRAAKRIAKWNDNMDPGFGMQQDASLGGGFSNPLHAAVEERIGI